jgi:serine/threonine protein phosphatase PrpC
VVTHDAIAAMLAETDGGLEGICQRLIAAANEAGGPDNITVLVLEVDAP